MQLIPCSVDYKLIVDLYNTGNPNDAICSEDIDEGEHYRRRIVNCTEGYYDVDLYYTMECPSDFWLYTGHWGYWWYNNAECEISCNNIQIFTDNYYSPTPYINDNYGYRWQLLKCEYPNLLIKYNAFDDSGTSEISAGFEIPFRYYKKIDYKIIHSPHIRYIYEWRQELDNNQCFLHWYAEVYDKILDPIYPMCRPILDFLPKKISDYSPDDIHGYMLFNWYKGGELLFSRQMNINELCVYPATYGPGFDIGASNKTSIPRLSFKFGNIDLIYPEDPWSYGDMSIYCLISDLLTLEIEFVIDYIAPSKLNDFGFYFFSSTSKGYDWEMRAGATNDYLATISCYKIYEC